MNNNSFLVLILILQFACAGTAQTQANQERTRFQRESDLLLAQFDCKTDVDDLHTVAAFATLMNYPDYTKVDYHAVAGTYGTQGGLYVPPNTLFELAFGENWSDAHSDRTKALLQVKERVNKTLDRGGTIWIADAGQSDFSALLIQAIQQERPDIQTKVRFHVVQHSNWNQKVTTPALLQYVKQNATYHKIPDGNTVGNGSPGFNTPAYDQWHTKLKNAHLAEIWKLAVQLGNQYNGKEGRYNNKTIASGGLDFSDLSETCWILGVEDIKDVGQFFDRFAQ
ncbi:MAG: hypothetical protein HKN16_13775 [Saprospiraceae bacterium]|nr:hypothetical protein [Saprospiraceae bacterium]